MGTKSIGLIIGAGIGVVIICGVICFIRSKSNSEVKSYKDLNDEDFLQKNVKQTLDNYFENIKENYSQYYLCTFYSKVLDVEDYNKDYILSDDLYKTIGKIGLSTQEENFAYKYMKYIIDDIFIKYNLLLNQIDVVEYKPFLEKYYEFLGKREALEILKSRTKKMDELNTHYEINNKNIEKLLRKYST